MGNSFAILGLRDETAHEQRDVGIRQTRVGERPDENEVVETKTLKSAESYSYHDVRNVQKNEPQPWRANCRVINRIKYVRKAVFLSVKFMNETIFVIQFRSGVSQAFLQLNIPCH